jgi:hypothetical protein
MTRLITPIAGASVGLFAAITWSQPSLADEPASSADTTASTEETPPPETDGAGATQRPQPADHGQPYSHARAGGALVLSGFVFLGLSYGPSLYVANRSGLPADHKLDIPFAGPWLDLGSRPGCAGGHNCANEPGYTAALVLDGFVQAVSAIQILAGLGELSRDEAAPAPQKKASGTAVVVTPAAFGTAGYGLGAVGRF